MLSERYRYYCLDHRGELHNVEWFNAADDAEAIALIQAKHPIDTCEIWHESRLLATLSPARCRA